MVASNRHLSNQLITEELDKIKVTVETAINAYATDNNFDLIIRSDGTTLYRKKHLDITEDIISELE